MSAAPTKLLFATRTSPFAGDSGSGTYVFDLLRHLTENGFKIHVIWTEPPDLIPSRGWYTPPEESHAVFCLNIMGMVKVGERFLRPDVVWLPFKAKVSHAVKTVLRKIGLWRERPANVSAAPASSLVPATPTAWGGECTSTEVSAIHKAILCFQPDVVLANYAWMAPASNMPGELRRPCAVLTHDVRHRQLHLREGQLTEILGEHMSVETELASLQFADALIAIQQTEAKVFSRLLPGKQVITAPMPVRPRPLPLPAKPAVLFIGSQHGPNVAGLNWFIEKVWPLIIGEVASAKLLVAGSVCRAFSEPQPAGVEILGRLPDLATAYARASVVVAPILQGSGIKIKILEAASYGRPCVTTSVGVEGLEALQPALRVADTPAAFASETVRLLQTQNAASASEQILALARAHLSAGACYDPVVNLLHGLARSSP